MVMHSCTRAQFRKCEEKCDWKPSLPWFFFLLKKLLYLYTVGFCDQATSWSSSCDELKNFAANILLKLVIKSRTGIRAIG